jgi:hypothetical protein
LPAVTGLQELASSGSAADFPLVSLRRERRRWLQKLQHALPAVVLLGAGVDRLRHGEQGFGLALAVLTAEALEHWYTTHHLPRPMLLTAAITLALGLFHSQLSAALGPRRSLRIDEAGIRVRRRFCRAFVASWADLERIEVDAGKARIVARDGRERRIDLADLQNGADVRQALLAAQARLAPPPA